MITYTPSYYCWEDFINDCGKGSSSVFVTEDAKITAKDHFNLKTEKEILDFISNGGLEKPQLQNITSKKKGQSQGVLVDAYTFLSRTKHGYIAFFKAPTGIWIIKSFKKNAQAISTPVLTEDFKKIFGGKL